ncbi:class I mannose-6-phosphate isomerase [soil metagenome]
MSLSPLRFEPLFKHNLWGGTALRKLLNSPTANDATSEATGEAWLLSDVDGSLSTIIEGPHAGKTLRDLLRTHAREILGPAKLIDGRFPLLLKIIDAKQELSVQVHPNDEQARAKNPTAAGKTEAWLVLDANPATSRIYAGFKPGVTAADFRSALKSGTTPQTLHQFQPKPGDCVFLEAGTVHAIGADILMFEVQQTSDITYRLYDWDRVEVKTGQPRELHIYDGLACSDFHKGPCNPVKPHRDGEREHLVACDYFTLDRFTIHRPMPLGQSGRCTLAVCIAGTGTLDDHTFTFGDTVLIPASHGVASIVPQGTLTLLAIGLGSTPC